MVYHFRYQIPERLRLSLGKWELRASLRTRCRRTANTMDSRLTHGCRCVFIRLELLPEELLMKMDTATLKAIVKNHINETISYYVDSHAVNGSPLQNTLENLDEMIDSTKRVLADGVHYVHMMDEIERISQELGIRIEEKAQAKQFLADNPVRTNRPIP